jgi:hypothetical protein
MAKPRSDDSLAVWSTLANRPTHSSRRVEGQIAGSGRLSGSYAATGNLKLRRCSRKTQAFLETSVGFPPSPANFPKTHLAGAKEDTFRTDPQGSTL